MSLAKCASTMSLLAWMATVLPAAEQLTPAQFQQQSDALGFTWDIYQQGQLNDGTNDLYDNGMMLQWQAGTGGGQFNTTGQGMQNQHGELVLAGQGAQGGVRCDRRVRMFPSLGAARYIELVHNDGTTEQTVTVRIASNLGNSVQSLRMLDGTQLGQGGNEVPLDGAKSPAVVVGQDQQRPDSMHFFGQSSAGCQIAFSAQSDDVQLIYRVKVPAQRKVALMHVLVQRGHGQALDKNTVAKLTGKDMLADIPPDILKVIINRKRAGFGGLTTLSLAHLELPHLEVDVLGVGNGGHLRGTAGWERARLATAYGDCDIPFAQLAGLLGRHRGAQACFLRDGQILVGSLTVEGFRFALRDGQAVLADSAGLDRLLTAGAPEDLEPPAGWQCSDLAGSRFVLAEAPSGRVEAATPWGPLGVSLSALRGLYRVGDDDIGAWRLASADGSLLPCFPVDCELELQARLFGPVRTRLLNLAGLEFRAPQLAEDEAGSTAVEPVLPAGQVRVGLGGDFVAVGVPELAVLSIRAGQTLRLPTPQVRRMNRTGEGQLRVELWDGSEVEGLWLDERFALRLGAGVLDLPARAVQAIEGGTPSLNPEQRAQLVALVARLGAASWTEREEADRALRDLGQPALPVLTELRAAQRDPEIVHRLDAILTAGKQ